MLRLSSSFQGISTWGYQQHFAFPKLRVWFFTFKRRNAIWCWKISYNSCMQKNSDGMACWWCAALLFQLLLLLMLMLLLLNIVMFLVSFRWFAKFERKNFRWWKTNETAYITTDGFRANIFSKSKTRRPVCAICNVWIRTRNNKQ